VPISLDGLSVSPKRSSSSSLFLFLFWRWLESASGRSITYDLLGRVMPGTVGNGVEAFAPVETDLLPCFFVFGCDQGPQLRYYQWSYSRWFRV
jgi:hypothetical protein